MTPSPALMQTSYLEALQSGGGTHFFRASGKSAGCKITRRRELRKYFLFISPFPQMANGVWMVGKTLYQTIFDWFRGRPSDLGW